jgi:hypothetical protein
MQHNGTNLVVRPLAVAMLKPVGLLQVLHTMSRTFADVLAHQRSLCMSVASELHLSHSCHGDSHALEQPVWLVLGTQLSVACPLHDCC